MSSPVKPGRPKKFSLHQPNSPEPEPGKSGLYRLRNRETGKVDYVGESNDVCRRAIEHARSGKWNLETHDLEWKEADSRSTSRTRRVVEREWIARHLPALNGNLGGGGFIARRTELCCICWERIPSRNAPQDGMTCSLPCARELVNRLNNHLRFGGPDCRCSLHAAVREDLEP